MDKLVLPASLDSLVKAREFVLPLAAGAGCSKETIADIELVLEELLVNVITHAYHGTEGDIELACEQRADQFLISLQDSGPAFDPFARPDPDITEDLAEREVGGLGIYLVKKLASDVVYERRGMVNWVQARFPV